MLLYANANQNGGIALAVMPLHSTTANVEWARLHELESIANSLEKIQISTCNKGASQLVPTLERIADALEAIAAKP